MDFIHDLAPLPTAPQTQNTMGVIAMIIVQFCALVW
jgi:hypothetical protein